MSTIEDRLSEVQMRIATACANAGRASGAVRLVAVTKTHPIERVREAYAAGQRDFAENYVQELETKMRALADLEGARWRLIGHLQRNKVKDVLELGAAVDTIDTLRLAEALAKRAQIEQKRVEVLIQVNVGGEAQKSGCAPADLAALVRGVRALDALDLRGLMTVPPPTADPEGARPFFRTLRELAAAEGLREL